MFQDMLMKMVYLAAILAGTIFSTLEGYSAEIDDQHQNRLVQVIENSDERGRYLAEWVIEELTTEGSDSAPKMILTSGLSEEWIGPRNEQEFRTDLKVHLFGILREQLVSPRKYKRTLMNVEQDLEKLKSSEYYKRCENYSDNRLSNALVKMINKSGDSQRDCDDLYDAIAHLSEGWRYSTGLSHSETALIASDASTWFAHEQDMAEVGIEITHWREVHQRRPERIRDELNNLEDYAEKLEGTYKGLSKSALFEVSSSTGTPNFYHYYLDSLIRTNERSDTESLYGEFNSERTKCLTKNGIEKADCLINTYRSYYTAPNGFIGFLRKQAKAYVERIEQRNALEFELWPMLKNQFELD